MRNGIKMINWADRLIDKKVDKITIEPINVQESGYLVKAILLLIMLSAIVFVLSLLAAS
jgi:hypothetical protein